jgi:alpha-beta hydrolase superfamily lysophospholipase
MPPENDDRPTTFDPLAGALAPERDSLVNGPPSNPTAYRWWAAAGVVGLGALAVAGGTALFAHLALRPWRRRRAEGMEELPHEAVRFPALDGTPLRGTFVPAVGVPRGVVILCHGYLMRRRGLVPYARFLRAAGYSCLLFDFRAWGESEGDLCTLGFQEKLDVRGAVGYLRGREDTRDLPVAGFGLSMGGVALILAAAEEPELRAIVADGIYPSLAQAIARRCELVFGPAARLAEPIVNGVIRRQLGADPAAVDVLSAVAQLDDRPTFFIHADRDIYLTPEDAEALLAHSSEPKALWRVANAPHCRAFKADPRGYERQVLHFLAAHGL